MSQVLSQRRRETLAALLRVGEMGTIGQILNKVQEIASDPNSDASHMAEVLSTDPGLTTRIIKLSNSAYYSLGRSKITSVQQAVVQLGFETVQRIAMTAQALNSIDEDANNEDMPMERFWGHSLACGLATKFLASRMKLQSDQDLFSAGFLHDISKPILWKYLPEKWERIVDMMRAKTDPIRAERDILGLSHAEISAWLLRMWRFPKEFCMAIGMHHSDGKNAGPLGISIIQANLIAHNVISTFDFAAKNKRMVMTQLARHGFTLNQINDLTDDVRIQVIKMAKEMELPLPPELDDSPKKSEEPETVEETKSEEKKSEQS